MRKLLTVLVLLSGSAVLGQSAKVSSAYIEFNNRKNIPKAFEFIEEAILDPKTGIEAKTWKYRFDILLGMEQSQKLEDKVLGPEKLQAELKRSYEKVAEFDKKGQYLKDIDQTIMFFWGIMIKQGNLAFETGDQYGLFKDLLRKYKIVDNETVNAEGLAKNKEALVIKADSLIREQVKKCLEQEAAKFYTCISGKEKEAFQVATVMFAKAAASWDLMGKTDSASIFNAAQSAYRAGLTDVSEEIYKQLIEIRYQDTLAHYQLIGIYKNKKDKDKLINIIKGARKSYPQSLDFIIEEINFYLADTMYAQAEEALKLAIEKDPSNYMLYSAVGSVYESLNKIPEAKKAYEKAYTLNAEDFNVLYNIGAVVVEEGRAYQEASNKLDYRKKAEIDELNKKAEAKFQEALTYLEKAQSKSPEDVKLLTALKQLYARLGMVEKSTEMKKKIDSLK